MQLRLSAGMVRYARRCRTRSKIQPSARHPRLGHLALLSHIVPVHASQSLDTRSAPGRRDARDDQGSDMTSVRSIIEDRPEESRRARESTLVRSDSPLVDLHCSQLELWASGSSDNVGEYSERTLDLRTITRRPIASSRDCSPSRCPTSAAHLRVIDKIAVEESRKVEGGRVHIARRASSGSPW